MAQAAAGQAEFINGIIENADQLIVAKRDIQSKLQEARNLLNSLKNQGMLTKDQVAWVEENLPRHKRARKGSADDSAGE